MMQRGWKLRGFFARAPHPLLVLTVAIAFLSALASRPTIAQSAVEHITVDANAAATPFPHFWEQMFGSGRANLAMRESYRDDMRAVKTITAFDYVRFHGILDDDNGVYNEDDCSRPVYNFAYVDQIYDGLLKLGVRPFVEISFMPKKLAFNPDALHPFWYKQNVSPPKSWDKWDDLMTHFAQHLVDRYGINEVSQWYFEVWNEPNIDFWNGIPRQQSYFELYEHTARDLKRVSPRLRVGGPATAAASWIPAFLKFTAGNHVPVDFVSTHGYADDTVENLFGSNEDLTPGLPSKIPADLPMDQRVCRAIGKVHDQIKSSATPDLPLFWTEWNVQGMHESRDTIFVGPAVANTIRQCDGLVTMMSFWTFSDVFEEGGPIPKPFEGHFGLRAEGGIDKPSYYGFALLHELGNQRLANPSQNVIVTKTQNGGLAIAVWNLVDPDKQGTTRSVELDFRGLSPGARVTLRRVDSDHSNTLKAYATMGKPLYPTPAQVDDLNRQTALGAPENANLENGKLTLTLTPNALVLVKVLP